MYNIYKMDSFTIILIIGCVIFLVVYYWLQWRKYSDEQMRLTWPRHINSCPDYWNHLGRGICQNKFEIGKIGDLKCGNNAGRTVDFTSELDNVQATAVEDEEELYKEMNTKEFRTAKCNWAKHCNVSWEGVDKLCSN